MKFGSTVVSARPCLGSAPGPRIVGCLGVVVAVERGDDRRNVSLQGGDVSADAPTHDESGWPSFAKAAL